MAEIRHLIHAPIKEAIIDIRCKLETELEKDRVSRIKEEIRDKYIKSEDIRAFEGMFAIKAGEPAEQYVKDKGVYGYLLKSEDGKDLVQFKNDGFTFNRLRPYTSWNEVITEAKKLWGLFLGNVKLENIIRVAVRYINQMDITLPIADFDEYLTKPPDVPSGVPNVVSSFLSRILVHDAEKGISANISQALETSRKSGFVTLILDIDAYKSVEISPSDSEQLWPIFEQLHVFKNVIFFNSITEKTARMYE